MRTNKQDVEIIAVSNSIDATLPEWTLLCPFGEPVKGDNGDFYVGQAEAESIVNSFQRHRTDMPIDYKHRSHSPRNIDDLKAAGWIKELKIVPNSGIMGRVEWTPRARTAIAAKEFRYLSPYVIARKRDRRAMMIADAGLTNTPAIEGMVPIVNSATLDLLGKESAMDAVMQALRELLGLGAEATEEEILAGINAMKEKLADSGTSEVAVENSRKLLKIVGEELKIADIDKADFEAIANSVRTGFKSLRDAASNDAAKLAIEQLKAANDRIAALEGKQKSSEWDAFVVANSKKIPPAQVEHYRKLWDSDRDAVVAIVNASPELVSTAGDGGGTKLANTGGDRLTIINSARSQFKEGGNWGGRTERSFINGTLLAGGQKALTDDEAGKLAIVG